MAGTNPRAARIAALIQRVVASAIEHQLHDKRLSGVTVTEVRVTNDLQIATVYWTQFGDEGRENGERRRAQQALRQATGKLRSLVGAKAGLRLTPQLRFLYDEVPSEAHEIEDILVAAHQRDEELARAREHARYAGDADPYRHNDEHGVDEHTDTGSGRDIPQGRTRIDDGSMDGSLDDRIVREKPDDGAHENGDGASAEGDDPGSNL